MNELERTVWAVVFAQAKGERWERAASARLAVYDLRVTVGEIGERCLPVEESWPGYATRAGEGGES